MQVCDANVARSQSERRRRRQRLYREITDRRVSNNGAVHPIIRAGGRRRRRRQHHFAHSVRRPSSLVTGDQKKLTSKETEDLVHRGVRRRSRLNVQMCQKKSRRIGCVIPHCKLQRGIAQPIFRLLRHICTRIHQREKEIVIENVVGVPCLPPFVKKKWRAII